MIFNSWLAIYKLSEDFIHHNKLKENFVSSMRESFLITNYAFKTEGHIFDVHQHLSQYTTLDEMFDMLACRSLEVTHRVEYCSYENINYPFYM